MADELALVFNKKFGETVTRNFKEFLETDLYVDLIFVCRNNVKIPAHQLVMSFMSKFFYELFAENGRTAKEKVIHVYVPDIRAKIMKHIIEFVYCGKARMNKNDLKEFNEDIKLLGMPLDVFTTANEANPVLSGNVNGSNYGPVINPPSVNGVVHPPTVNSVVNPPRVNSVVNPPGVNGAPATIPIPTTDFSTAVTPPLPVSPDEPSTYSTHHSESDVSSSNLSVLPPGPSTTPTLTSIMPVIVATQSLKRSVNSQSEPSSIRVDEPTQAENGTSTVTRDSLPRNCSNTTTNGVPSKRRRLSIAGRPPSDFISLDSDDDDDVVIALS